MTEKPHVKLPAEVEKVLLFQEIRVENTLKDTDGKKVRLKEGAEVEVKIEADDHAIEPKNS